MSEALRIARKGILASELWFDLSITSQKLGFEVDNWCKRLHQALGFYHRSYLNAGEIISLIKTPDSKNILISYDLIPEPCDIDFWLAAQQQNIDQLSSNHVFHRELKNLKQKMQNELLSKPGWLIVMVLK